MAVPMAAAGPAGLVASGIIAAMFNLAEGRGFHVRMKPLTHEERWLAFDREYHGLSRYYFDHGHNEGEDLCKCEPGGSK